MELLTDLRQALRRFSREPGAVAAAVITLALAIGASTAVFGVVDALLLKPLPLPDAGRLMQIMQRWSRDENTAFSVAKFIYLRDNTTTLADPAAFEMLGSGFNLSGDGAPERLRGSRVSEAFFRCTGVQPFLGRGFLPEEDRPGGRKAVVLSHRLWARRFASDPHVIGRRIVLNSESSTVVGVMPPSFRFPASAELWVPFQMNPGDLDASNFFQVLARLKPGVTASQAHQQLSILAQRFAATYPGQMGPRPDFAPRPLQEMLYGHLRPTLQLLLGGVVLVVLIACVNVANLQLVRASTRHREVALRLTLGAGGGRIVRQLLVESLLLGLTGGALGLLVAHLALAPFVAANPWHVDRIAEVGIDGRALLWTLAVSLLAGTVCGLTPALQAARARLQETIQAETSRAAGSSRARLGRRLLIISEVALALILLTGATLLLRSLFNLTSVPPGFAVQHVLSAKLSLPPGAYTGAEALARLDENLGDRLRSVPGVVASGIALTLPLDDGAEMDLRVIGKDGAGASTDQGLHVEYRALSPEVHRVLGVQVVRGRDLAASDRHGAPLVAVLNRSAARRYFPHSDPVGQLVSIGPLDTRELCDPGPRTIVGVVGDVHETGLDQDVPPVLYVPIAQMPDGLAKLLVKVIPVGLVVRTTGELPGLARALSREVWAVDHNQPVADVQPFAQTLAGSFDAQRFSAALLVMLAALALLLASIGIYSVLSYLVSQRRREIGVRLALGASMQDIQRLVVGQGLQSVLIGVAVGTAGALALSRLLSSLLFGVSAHDPWTFVIAPLLLIVVAAAASSLPARRASRLDPLVALRLD